MNPLHLNLLIDLRIVGQFGQTIERELPLLRVSGHRSLTQPELEKALRDLADKAWVAPFDSVFGNKHWRITQLGLSALTEAGI